MRYKYAFHLKYMCMNSRRSKNLSDLNKIKYRIKGAALSTKLVIIEIAKGTVCSVFTLSAFLVELQYTRWPASKSLEYQWPENLPLLGLIFPTPHQYVLG